MTSKKVNKNTMMVSDSFERTDEKCSFEVAFRRWLIRELEEKRMSVNEAAKRFNFASKSAITIISRWRKRYAPEMILPLESMTEAEKQKLEALQQHLKDVEKQLEYATMKNIALNMLIDVAEEKLKISIRKKSGAKQ